MRTKYLFLTLLLSLPLTSFLCPADKAPEADPCGGEQKMVEKDTVIRPGGQFYLEAPPGENECHGVYGLFWQYLDDVDAVTDPTMPVIYNLDQGFGPAGEFSYFPHAAPARKKNELGQYVWEIAFTAGNKNSSYESTEHSISVRVPSETEDPKAKPIKIRGAIRYIPYGYLIK